jgi:hypothetical protein
MGYFRAKPPTGLRFSTSSANVLLSTWCPSSSRDEFTFPASSFSTPAASSCIKPTTSFSRLLTQPSQIKQSNKDNLGYHDIRIGNTPDARLSAFLSGHLPAALPDAWEKFDEYYDLISGFVHNELDYAEFAARVRRRHGTNEDNDWEEIDVEPDPPDDFF